MYICIYIYFHSGRSMKKYTRRLLCKPWDLKNIICLSKQ